MTRCTITVGPATADLPGYTHAVVQAAVERAAALGGGTVRLLAGRYELRNAVRLRNGVRLEGEGDDTCLVKAAEVRSELLDDTDWYEAVVRVKDPAGFRVGDGVVLQATPPGGGSAGLNKTKATVVAIEGHHLHLDQTVRKNYWTDLEATCATLFPLVWIEEATDCEVADLRLDGAREANSLLDGNHAGCVFMQDARRVVVDNVTAHNYHGDGLSWQVADDVAIRGCRTFGHAGLGLHPGSGSQRPVIRDTASHHNLIGCFFCWGVKHGVVEHCRFEDNRRFGVDLGHRDTDNLIRGNVIARNGEVGIHFRPEQPAARLPHRNRFEDNDLVDNGAAADGLAVWVRDAVEDTLFARNRIWDSGEGRQRVGLRIDPEVGRLELVENRFEGLGVEVDDRRV